MGATAGGLLAGLLISVLGVTACGQDPQQAQPPPPPTTPAPMPPPAASTSPVYPSIGDRLGDPNRIGPDDLRLAVAAAQSSVSNSRLLAIEPGTAAGRPVWNVRLLTGGPSLKQAQVDAVVRGAQTNDAQQPQQADVVQILNVANAAKTPWDDAVATVQRQNPGSTPASVALDTSAPTPAWKVTMLTGNQQISSTVDANTGAIVGSAPGPRPQPDYR
jgi:hypothetical protein